MNNPMQLLDQGARELGLHLTDRQIDQFDVYYRELFSWNQRVNLTAIRDYEGVQVKHFLDSLTACLAFPQGLPEGISDQCRVIDIGSGAGFPGLPLKLIFPQISLTLADSVGKKTAFLHHLVGVLQLPDVSVLTERAEALGQDPNLRESFDLVLARGLAKMPALLEYALPLCRVGGRVLAWKHGGIQPELAGAERALKTLGGRWVEIIPIKVTGLTDNRILVVAEKISPTPAEYPRRIGLPAKQPL